MQENNYELSQLNLLPKEPGIYKFINTKKEIIYVGKAKNLYNRVKSYFSNSAKHSLKTKKLISNIDSVEITIVDSEYDALLLENNLIKSYKPKYNILLRDDKSFPYICILNEPFPRVLPVRNLEKFKGDYFGPFTDLDQMYKILDLIRVLFKIRTCNYNLSKQNIEAKKYKVCLEYHIKKCLGPCENKQSQESYDNDIAQVKNLLNNNFSNVISQFRVSMKDASKNLDFEKAQGYKEKIQKLETYKHKSVIISPYEAVDTDVFAIVSTEKKSFISYLHLKNGVITFTKNYEIDKKLDETDEDILELYIVHLRKVTNSLAKEILTNKDIIQNDIKAKIIQPLKGDKRTILELAIKNAFQAQRNFINKKIVTRERSFNITEQLKMDLNIDTTPQYIECFDNSNIQGSNPVSSMICFKDGKPFKSNYRKFIIKTVKGPNDYETMEEVVSRRYKSLLKDNETAEKPYLPNLIVIDGGKGQLNVAVKILKELNLYPKIQIISIAKRLEEIYKPYEKYPLLLSKSSPSLKLLQRIRDEAHRFAITFHKKRRNKNAFKSEIESIPGIGKKTLEILFKKLKSIKSIKEANQSELEEIVGKSRAKKIIEFFSKPTK